MNFRLLSALIVAFTLSSSAIAFAEDADSMGSEFLYQAPAGTFAVAPHVAAVFTAVDYKAGSMTPDISRASSTAILLGATLGYGFSQMAAVSLDIGGSNYSNSFDCRSGACSGTSKTGGGMTDPVLGLKLRNDIWRGTLRYGADVNVSLEKSKTDLSGLKTNAASGGSGVTPFIGYEIPVYGNYAGAVVSYELYKGDRKQTNSAGTESTIKDGQILAISPYFEYRRPMHTSGFALLLKQIADTHVGGTSQRDGHSSIGVKLYDGWYITKAWTLLPQLTIQSAQEISSNSPVNSEIEYLFGFAARYTF